MKKHVMTSLAAAMIALSPIIPFNVLSTAAVQAQEQGVKTNYKSRAEIPAQYKWKTEHIYQSKAAWKADVKKAEQLSAAFKKNYQGKLAKSAAIMKKALEDYSTLSRIHDKAYVYANLNLDVHSTYADLQSSADRAEKMTTTVSENSAWFNPELVKIPSKQMNNYLKDKSLAPYKYMLSDIIRTKSHTLSQDQEELLAKLSPLSSTGANVYEKLATDVKFPKIKDEKGREVPLTRSNFISYMESKDRNVRKQAYEAYYQTLGKFQDTFAQSLSSHVQSHNIAADVRKYKSAVEAALSPNNIPVKVYDQLINSVNKGLPQMHRYMELKKKMLGVDELQMYDIYAPIVEADKTYISYDEAQKQVLEGLKPLGEDYAKILKEAFTGGWVDVYSTDDKQSGAYQWGAYDTHPFVLLNYQGTNGDVSTIAHELGHAAHSYYSKIKQPYLTSSYATFTAEVASTMNENLLWHSQYKKAKTKAEKMYLLNLRLENFRTTLFRQTQFAEFEKAIHELDQKGESVNAAALKNIYGGINKKYYGKVMVADEEIAMEWARIPHFYNYKFYVYQYATSFAASVALSKQVLEQGAPSVKRIKENFLQAGGSADPISILKSAGVDMSTSKPVDEAMEVFRETLDELEKLMNEK
ncbi:oligoendopeptidase F [Peribacillus saganii]|uniref:Oligopeptidase F n=1 Tax=Peribacillus saganii TaxID=2303992 RepID=A0A372LE45_9BACI|nr:oligoendopeptidase F [Peribacillus saganii]RFU64499.1 oligoendopeptidase F [Peribacillus saganii]